MKNRLGYLKTVAFGLLIVAATGCDSNKAESNGGTSGIAENNKTATNPDASNPEPVLTFEKKVVDFGKIYEGQKPTYTFKYKNTGNENLVIRACKTSCGCTVAKCDKAPLAPGGEGEIKITFDSNHKVGKQSKSITITANTNPPETVLTFKAEVLPQ